MPNIKVYEQPQLGITPSDRGANAAVEAGRRGDALFNQAASALDRTGASIGGGVKAAGEVAIEYESNQQITVGAAEGQRMFAALLEQKDDLIRGIDPKDPAFGVKVETAIKQWRDESLEPALEQYRGGFSTEKSQQYAGTFVDKVRSHLFTQTAGDIGSAAKIGITNSIRDFANVASNLAMRDPSMVPAQLDLAGHAVSSMVAGSNLKGIDAATVQSDLLHRTQDAIIKSGAIGAISKSSNPEQTALEWGEKYSKYISGAELKMLAANARQQIRAARTDAAYVNHLQKVEQEDRSNKTEIDYLKRLYSDDMKEKASVTTKAVVNDDNLTRVAKERMIGIVKREVEEETATDISNRNYVGLLSDIRSGKIADVGPIYDARIGGKVNRADFNQALKDFTDFRSPDGQRYGKAEEQFITAVKPIIDKSNPLMGKIDQDGPLNTYRLRMDIKKKVDEYRAAGKDWRDLFDPSKPEFMGSPAALAPYQKTLQQSIQDQSRRLRGYNITGPGQSVISVDVQNLPIPPRPAPVPRKPGETAAEYLKRTGG